MTYKDVWRKYGRAIKDIVVDFRTNEATIVLRRGGAFIARSPQDADDYLATILGFGRRLSKNKA